MAQKKITDLSLRSDADETCNFPVDDAVQTWRITLAQIQAFLLPDGGLAKAKLETAVQNALVPTGTVLAWAGGSAPAGFLSCDGSAVSRSTYSDLFTAIGVAHGYGDNSTTFNLPDYRGRFLRGTDGSAGLDPDKAGRVAMATGGNSGNNVGSVQADAFKAHGHDIDRTSSDVWGTGLDTTANVGANDATGANGDQIGATKNTGGSETRPVNAYVGFIIKI